MHELMFGVGRLYSVTFEVRFMSSFHEEGRSAAAIQPVGTSNLVDPASSHTLVSKIKPCMSKYKQSIL
jgi:hypothetical protein